MGTTVSVKRQPGRRAVTLGLLLLTTLALMQRAVNLSFEDWSYAQVWFYLPLFYFFAIPIISKRYDAE